MKTALLHRPKNLSLVDRPAPADPTGSDVVVKVRRVGVCGTDLHAYQGRQPFVTYPRVLGHELGVEVAAIGPEVCDLAVGDLCAVRPYLTCGRCIACRHGRTNCCQELRCLGVHVDGAMADFAMLPAQNLYRSTTLSVDELALIEPLGIGAHAVARAAILPGESVLVIGAGPIGVATAQFALVAGGAVSVMDLRHERLRFCHDELGIEQGIDAADDPLARLLQASSELPTVVFDCTGNKASMAGSLRYTAPGGRVVFVGLVNEDVPLDDPLFHRREITLHGSRNSTDEDFRRVVRLVEERTIDTAPWITHRCSLASVEREFPTWFDPEAGVMKAMIHV